MRHELLRETQAHPICVALDEQFCLVGKHSLHTRYTVTQTLPRRTQAKLMRAASFSQTIGCPINAILTINAAHLQHIGEGGIFGIGHLWDGLQELLELIRKWVLQRGVAWSSIWVREWTRRGHRDQAGEHWHIALHLPKYLHTDFAKQVAEWTCEAVGKTASSARDAAISVFGAWHLAVHHGRGGPDKIAAYLGKAEPSRITRYGRWVPNPDKPRRNQNGGAGYIEGKRFGICKTLGATEQAKLRHGTSL